MPWLLLLVALAQAGKDAAKPAAKSLPDNSEALLQALEDIGDKLREPDRRAPATSTEQLAEDDRRCRAAASALLEAALAVPPDDAKLQQARREAKAAFIAGPERDPAFARLLLNDVWRRAHRDSTESRALSAALAELLAGRWSAAEQRYAAAIRAAAPLVLWEWMLDYELAGVPDRAVPIARAWHAQVVREGRPEKEVADARFGLASALGKAGAHDERIALLRAAVPGDPETADLGRHGRAIRTLGQALFEARRYAEAARLRRRDLEDVLDFDLQLPDVFIHGNDAAILRCGGAYEDLIGLHRRGIAHFTAKDKWDAAAAHHSDLARVYCVAGRYAEALAALDVARAADAKHFKAAGLNDGPGSDVLLRARILREAGKPHEALALFGDRWETSMWHLAGEYARCLTAVGRYDEALRAAKEPDFPYLAQPSFLHAKHDAAVCRAAALAGKGERSAAEALLRATYDWTQTCDRTDNYGVRKHEIAKAAALELAALYEAWGKPDAAAAWRKTLAERHAFPISPRLPLVQAKPAATTVK